MFGNAPRPKRHPGKMPGGIKLIECIHELQSIYRMMPVTDRDRDDRAYRGFASLASPTMIGDQVTWTEQAYLADAATEAFREALSTARLSVWCDYEGDWTELDSDIMFARNKWDRRAVLGAGVYRPLNLHRDHGDEQRASCDDATLWIRVADWPKYRDVLIAERERRTGSVLTQDWRTILDRTRRHVAGKLKSIRPPQPPIWPETEITVQASSTHQNPSSSGTTPAQQPRVPEAAIREAISDAVEKKARVNALQETLKRSHPHHAQPGRADIRRRHKEAWEAKWGAGSYPSSGRPSSG